MDDQHIRMVFDEKGTVLTLVENILQSVNLFKIVFVKASDGFVLVHGKYAVEHERQVHLVHVAEAACRSVSFEFVYVD